MRVEYEHWYQIWRESWIFKWWGWKLSILTLSRHGYIAIVPQHQGWTSPLQGSWARFFGAELIEVLRLRWRTVNFSVVLVTSAGDVERMQEATRRGSREPRQNESKRGKHSHNAHGPVHEDYTCWSTPNACLSQNQDSLSIACLLLFGFKGSPALPCYQKFCDLLVGSGTTGEQY